MSRENQELHGQWREQIATQRASGLSQKEWCKREGISKNTFGWWIKQLGLASKPGPTGKASGAFVQVVPIDEPVLVQEAGTNGGIVVSVIRMQFPAGYDHAGLCEIIERIVP